MSQWKEKGLSSADFENPVSGDDEQKNVGAESSNGVSSRPNRSAFEAESTKTNDSEGDANLVEALAQKGILVTRQYGSDALTSVNAMFATTFFKTDEEVIDYRKNWFGLLHPHAPLRRAYNMFHIFILLYFLYVLPKRIGFGQVAEGLMVQIDAIIDILVFVDIVINFRAYYFDKRNILVVHPKAIRSKYLRTWFAIDFLAIVPADQVVLIVATTIDSDVLKSWVSTIRLSRLLRILRLANLNSMLQTRKIKKHILCVYVLSCGAIDLRQLTHNCF